MGDDFKINVKGENEVRSIFIWGDGYGGNLTISGDGKLVVNKQKLQETAINMRAEGTKGILTIESTVDMEMYSQKGYPVIETIGASNGDKTKAIAIKGKTSVSYTHLRAHETRHDLVCRLLLEKKKKVSYKHPCPH